MRGLDFETFCEVSLPDRGLDNYLKHPSFRPLIASIAHRNSRGVIIVDRYDFVTGSRAPLAADKLDLFARDISDIADTLVAHNASFERGVLDKMGLPNDDIIDSAVISRGVGAGQKLEAAAPQLLGVDKLADGWRLIKKFSMPQENGYVYIDHVEDWTKEDWEDWELFGIYCDLDAELSLRIAEEYADYFSTTEWQYEALTQDMNDVGWFVDLELVERMQEQRDLNKALLERTFRASYDPDEKLNFHSTPQLRKWCAERGIKAQSFDEMNVTKLLGKVDQRIDLLAEQGRHDPNLRAVRDMLLTKQELGGSSLSKLEKIRDLVGEDGRLRGQYLHIGAGQTFRTSGRGAQMQNLKRLGKQIGNVTDSLDDWDNDELASNLRQVFKAEHPLGIYLVGDFSSVESRGLAYEAGADWKLQAYAKGKDMYKVLAASMFGVRYEAVTPEQRQTGKVGELSCGYGAGPQAVKDFAEKMGVDFTLAEAGQLVTDWRDTNPEVVQLWATLDRLLHDVVERKQPFAEATIGLKGEGLSVMVAAQYTPPSLRQQKPGSQTISLRLYHHGVLALQRWFQGAFMDGRDVCYHKPSELKGGKLWMEKWSKNGQSGRYKIYGGKLTGILTQSFCREIFFDSMLRLDRALDTIPNARIVGQFHDEIVVEWWPDHNGSDLDHVQDLMGQEMASARGFSKFPLAAEIKTAHRYIK